MSSQNLAQGDTRSGAGPAPIALFVYNRVDHAQSTLEALRENGLAGQTDLFIFSDGPKDESDESGVAQVRALVRRATGFKSVQVEESKINKGLAASIIDGVTKIVNRYGRVIVIEDDLVTHPSTLGYFNAALDHFENHASVFSISAYSHPADVMPIPERYEFDVYAIPRMQCWGWATWKDRWAKADFGMTDFNEFNGSPTLTNAFSYWVGGDSLVTLRQYMAGEKDVWACRWVYTHFKHHAVCVCPTVSLVDNIGLDGSGANCGPRDDLKNELEGREARPWRFPTSTVVDPEIFGAFMQVMDPSRDRGLMGAQPSSVSRTSKPGTLERLLYWGQHPRKLLRRVFEVGTEQFVEAFGDPARLPKNALNAAHEQLTASPSVPLVRLGTDYGGWCVPETGLGPNDVVVSAGAGEDISFDIEISKRFGCKVLLLDPTPRAVRHFDETKDAIAGGNAAAINGSATEFYQASADDMDRISFRPWGLWKDVERLRFFEPDNPDHVSHSIGNLHQTEDGFEAECVTLEDLMAREGLKKVSVLKMDIEGAEFDVLSQILDGDIRPKYLLAEFHPGKDQREQIHRVRTLQMLRRLHADGYRLVYWDGWDYVLERQAA